MPGRSGARAAYLALLALRFDDVEATFQSQWRCWWAGVEISSAISFCHQQAWCLYKPWERTRNTMLIGWQWMRNNCTYERPWKVIFAANGRNEYILKSENGEHKKRERAGERESEWKTHNGVMMPPRARRFLVACSINVLLVVRSVPLFVVAHRLFSLVYSFLVDSHPTD